VECRGIWPTAEEFGPKPGWQDATLYGRQDARL